MEQGIKFTWTFKMKDKMTKMIDYSWLLGTVLRLPEALAHVPLQGDAQGER